MKAPPLGPGRYRHGIYGETHRVVHLIASSICVEAHAVCVLCGADPYRSAQHREFSHSVAAITCCRWRYAAAGELTSRLSPRHVGFAEHR
jgi:hypothetical protein